MPAVAEDVMALKGVSFYPGNAGANVLLVDFREAALKEPGDVILSKAPIYAEAGEVFAGRGRCPEGVTTIFKSVGLAMEDVAAARLVFEASGGKP